jgi:16S rRNA (uracil1498-N3)-methyltransferase
MSKHFIGRDAVKDGQVALSGAAAHHLSRVLRMRLGDAAVLCDGAETDYTCEITRITADVVTLAVRGARPSGTELPLRVTLFQGMPKGGKMENILQKCVELGVFAVVPVYTEHSVPRARGEEKTARYQAVAEAAAAQSMRGIIPCVLPAVSFEDALARTADYDNIWVAWEREEKMTLAQTVRCAAGLSAGLWVGPEGGFSNAEMKALSARGARTFTLGRRVLRAETAGMAALAVIACLTECV